MTAIGKVSNARARPKAEVASRQLAAQKRTVEDVCTLGDAGRANLDIRAASSFLIHNTEYEGQLFRREPATRAHGRQHQPDGCAAAVPLLGDQVAVVGVGDLERDRRAKPQAVLLVVKKGSKMRSIRSAPEPGSLANVTIAANKASLASRRRP